MEVFVDRNGSRMQVLTKADMSSYSELSVIMARGDHHSGLVLYNGIPSPNLLFSYGFSTNDMADIYLVGMKPSHEEVIIDTKPMRGGVLNSNLLLRQEAVKVHEQRRRRLLLAEEVILYLRQNEERCSCWNAAYENAQPGCTTCGGTGVVTSHLGVRAKVAIPDAETVKYQREASGIANQREYGNCFCGSFPYLQDRDVLERGSGERYFIQKTSDQRLGNELVGQEFGLVVIQDYYPVRFVMAGG